jgi:hypothetical protein
MRAIPTAAESRTGGPNELETILLSAEHLDYLGQAAQELNPDMPASFGLPHLIRTILDRIAESGVDLTEARSEEDIARLAAGRLRQRTTARCGSRPTERTFSSNSSAARRSYRSNRPATDPFRSGKPPRSGRG